MTPRTEKYLFGPVMAWTVLTSIFAWLPLVRILARPDGYQWAILGLSGEGASGPFWIFVPLTAWVLLMLYTAHRGPRRVFYPLLITWQVAVTGVVAASVALGGADARWQGQGLHWSVPMWLVIVPCIAFTVMAVVWAVTDARAGGAAARAPWNRTNTMRLAGSLALLVAALVLFRAGTNYNWVTAAAIVATIVHWILLVESFQPVRKRSRVSQP